MRIELSRDDVEKILRNYLGMDTVVLNDDGSATFDTVLEKLVGEKQEPIKPAPYISPIPYIPIKPYPIWATTTPAGQKTITSKVKK